MKKLFILCALFLASCGTSTKITKQTAIDLHPQITAAAQVSTSVSTSATAISNDAAVIKADAVRASAAPTTQEVQPILSEIGNKADNIQSLAAKQQEDAKQIKALGDALAVIQKQADDQIKIVNQTISTLTKERDKYKVDADKYNNQWFAHKFWTAFWSLVIGGSVLVVIALICYAKFSFFDLPLQWAGHLLGDFFAGLVKVPFNVLKGLWNRIFPAKK